MNIKLSSLEDGTDTSFLTRGIVVVFKLVSFLRPLQQRDITENEHRMVSLAWRSVVGKRTLA